MTALYTAVKYQTQAFTQFRASDYLAKPLEAERLRALLHKYLGG
jgi:DNA-binding LytR/AlgR family response regulator